jgi:hypothetical protein
VHDREIEDELARVSAVGRLPCSMCPEREDMSARASWSKARAESRLRLREN